MVAFFNSAGIVPSFIDLLNKIHSGLTILDEHCFSNCDGTPSGPAAACDGISLIASNTSGSPILTFDN